MKDRRILHALTIAAALASVVAVSHSVASDCDTSPAAICSRCGEKVCMTFATPGKQTKSCWDVECHDVCIPAVRFPWHCCRKSKCGECLSTALPRWGKVRCARKLKQVEYECDACDYEHRVVCRCPNCGPVPHAECGCVPTLTSNEAEDETHAVELAETDSATTAAAQETASAANPPSRQTPPKPRWSDRLRSRLAGLKAGFEPKPQAVEDDLSRLIGHSRFDTGQAE